MGQKTRVYGGGVAEFPAFSAMRLNLLNICLAARFLFVILQQVTMYGRMLCP